MGTAYVRAPTPTPPSHVLGGVVEVPCVDGVSAAQNMKPSMPGVVPAPLGATVCTYVPVEPSSDDPNVVHSGRTREPAEMNRLPVNLAGASGGMGGLNRGLPSTCSCQVVSASEALVGCLLGTIALA